MKTALIIFGAGGHAKVVAESVACKGRYAIKGFIDTISPERRGEPFCGATLLGGVEVLETAWSQGVRHAAIAIGDNGARLEIARHVLENGLVLPPITHPSAIVSPSAIVGNGSVLLAGSIVNAGVTMGELCILNTAASIDHDCKIGRASHLCPGARLAGSVQIGDAVMIGTGAVVLPGVTVGDRATIGAGSVVTRDVPCDSTVAGNPARPL